MTPNSKHIFIQVNTDAIIELYNKYGDRFPDGAILGQTILYEQGSLALGSPIKDMYLDVEAGQEVYLTILPLLLYGHDKVYFSDFIQESAKNIISDLPKFDSHILSYKIVVDENAVVGAEERFGMKAVLEHAQDSDKPLVIDMTIDPVLRVIQRRQK